jgi:hypothetical protein
MATAVTIKPSSSLRGPQATPPSRTASQPKHNRPARGAEPLLRPRPTVMTAVQNAPAESLSAASPSVSGVASTAISSSVSSRDGSTCDACCRRKIRCAMNETVNKCYSCDFHRQECTFTISAQRRKRKLDEAVLDGVESVKKYATANSP